MLSLKEGKKLIEIARKELDSYFKGQEIEKFDIEINKNLEKRAGVFVSLHTYPANELRGCIGIGFPISKIPLWESVREAVKASAFEDSRFFPLTKDELDKVIIEISVLTKPEMIEVRERKNPEDIFSDIEIGKDGLMLEYSGYLGIFLPQVPVEQGWDVEHYLEQLCLKAGVSPKTWKNKTCKIYKFQAQIFSEAEPRGDVREIKLKTKQ
jgi:uncharacterized protein (TIGR00296 family)